MKLSIIIPVFNEEKTVKQLIQKVKSVTLPQKLKKEIIVINDASTDTTEKILSKIKGVKLIHHKINLGKGAAIKTAFRYVKGQIIAIQDADLEYNPEDLRKLINPILKNKTYVCFGTRLKNYPLRFWGKNKTVLPTHWIANKSLSLLTSLLYQSKISDMETCYKVFRKEVIEKINLRSSRFDFEPEITAKILKQGYKILELPIKVNPRTKKQGKKIQFQDGLFAIWALLKYRFFD